MEFRAIEASKQISTVTNLISPGEIESFRAEFQIQSRGSSGDANKDLRCSHKLLDFPTKEICP